MTRFGRAFLASLAHFQHPSRLWQQLFREIRKRDRYPVLCRLELHRRTGPQQSHRLHASYIFEEKVSAWPARQNREQVAALGGEERFDARLAWLGLPYKFRNVVG